MAKNIILWALCCMTNIVLIAQEKLEILLNGGGRAVMETLDGRLHGKYTSYYSNGKKCAEGYFNNNFRKGKWMVWDSVGNKKIEKNYKAPFVYTQSKPLKNRKNNVQYIPQRTTQGFFDNCYVSETDVHFEKLIWRFISADNNPIFFDGDKLFNALIPLIKDTLVHTYTTHSFEKELDMSKTDWENFKNVGFKIKELYFFDTKRDLCETYVISLCPVVIDKKSKETKDLCWLYYKELRPFLAKESVSRAEIPSEIQNIDDCFFFRYFYGQIYKESNIYDRALVDYVEKENLKAESNRIEVELIEMEHKAWLYLAAQ